MAAVVWTHPRKKKPGAHPCAICGELDGRAWEAGTGPEPPLHVNCDCTLLPSHDAAGEWFDWGSVSDRGRKQIIGWLAWKLANAGEVPAWVRWLPLAWWVEVKRRAEEMDENSEEQGGGAGSSGGSGAGSSGGSGGGSGGTSPQSAPQSAQGAGPGPVPYERFQAVVRERDELRQRAGEAGTLQERIAAIEAERDQEKAARLRLEVATAKGLPADLAGRLHGQTREELEQDAEALAGLVKSGTPGVPPPSKGGQGQALDITKMSPEEIRKNAAKLWNQSTRR